MPPVRRDDPYSQFNFLVSLSGVSDDSATVQASFSEVSGLGMEIDVIEYRVGSERRNTPRKLPGLVRYSNITLKRGIVGDDAFWKWLDDAASGQLRRADGTITLLDENRQEVVRWVIRRAWPCKWHGPRLDAQGTDVAMEELVLAHEGLELD